MGPRFVSDEDLCLTQERAQPSDRLPCPPARCPQTAAGMSPQSSSELGGRAGSLRTQEISRGRCAGAVLSMVGWCLGALGGAHHQGLGCRDDGMLCGIGPGEKLQLGKVRVGWTWSDGEEAVMPNERFISKRPAVMLQ